MRIAHVGVRANEGKTACGTYKGVYVECEGKEVLFNTGDFPNDFMSATIHIMLADYEHAMMSSSVDHFTMDSGHAFAWHENDIMGEYPVKSVRDGSPVPKWDKFSVAIPKKQKRRDIYVLSGGSIVVSDRGNGKASVSTPDDEAQEIPYKEIKDVLDYAEKLKKKVGWGI